MTDRHKTLNWRTFCAIDFANHVDHEDLGDSSIVIGCFSQRDSLKFSNNWQADWNVELTGFSHVDKSKDHNEQIKT